MSKEYTSLGLMSGTSGDGIDASIITTDGITKYEVVLDKYYEYDNRIFQKIHQLKEKIQNYEDLIKLKKECNELEKNITLFHAKIINDIIKKKQFEIVGFHGQTIFHNSEKKISKQLGDGNLLFQLIKKKIVFNFRQNDIKCGGEGAPLSPIFHQLIAKKLNLDVPAIILNIGGISNITLINSKNNIHELKSKDIGPGNCLIDKWIRNKSEFKFDKDGTIAKKGNINELIIEQAQEFFSNSNINKNFSLDTNDYDISFVRGLSVEDGAATLTNLTAKIIGVALSNISFLTKKKKYDVLLSGGGRKNSYLISKIKENITKELSLSPIDIYGIDGDFIESQAFAFLAVRSFLNLPISFPGTTGCNGPTTGGELIKC